MNVPSTELTNTSFKECVLQDDNNDQRFSWTADLVFGTIHILCTPNDHILVHISSAVLNKQCVLQVTSLARQASHSCQIVV